jgi:hypothetical protein
MLYLRVLQKLNGMSAFGFALFGIPPSMTKSPPLLDRSVLQPLDIATANKDWRREYFVADELFYFGVSDYSDDELVGYFLAESGTVHAFRKSGEAVGGWRSLGPFLQDELARAEEDYRRPDPHPIKNKPWWRR